MEATECPEGKPMTTTTIENPQALIDSIGNQKKASTIIDSDALLLAQYSHQAFLLYEKKRELKEEYKRMYQAEASAINEKLKELIRQCEELRPKPKCFGTNDCCEIPACDECKFIRGCHRAVMVQEGI